MVRSAIRGEQATCVELPAREEREQSPVQSEPVINSTDTALIATTSEQIGRIHAAMNGKTDLSKEEIAKLTKDMDAVLSQCRQMFETVVKDNKDQDGDDEKNEVL